MWSEQAYLGDVWMSEDVAGVVQDTTNPDGRMCIDDVMYARTCLDMPTLHMYTFAKRLLMKRYCKDAQDYTKYPVQQHFQAHTLYKSLQTQEISSDLCLRTEYAHKYMQHRLQGRQH